MIDTVEFSFKWKHPPFGRSWKAHSNRKVKFAGKYPWASLFVTSMHQGTVIKVEGSLAKYFQGHNAFGTNRLRALCKLTVASVLDWLQLEHDPKSIARAVANAELSRLDLACSFRCRNAIAVPRVIGAIKKQFSRCSEQVSFYGDETFYLWQSSSVRSLKFYDKGRELAKKYEAEWREHRYIDRFSVREYATGLLRFEVVLRRLGLEAEKRTRVRDWSLKAILGQFDKWLRRLAVSGQVHLLESHDEILEQLTPSDRRIFWAWLAGDLVQSTSASTRAHKRAQFQGYGINLLERPPPPRSRKVDLAELLSRERMLVSYPRATRVLGKVAGV